MRFAVSCVKLTPPERPGPSHAERGDRRRSGSNCRRRAWHRSRSSPRRRVWLDSCTGGWSIYTGLFRLTRLSPKLFSVKYQVPEKCGWGCCGARLLGSQFVVYRMTRRVTHVQGAGGCARMGLGVSLYLQRIGGGNLQFAHEYGIAPPGWPPRGGFGVPPCAEMSLGAAGTSALRHGGSVGVTRVRWSALTARRGALREQAPLCADGFRLGTRGEALGKLKLS